MENEQIKIFNESMEQIGVATREEVHRIGYWHESIQCWFVSEEKGTHYIYLQHRSKNKRDYPDLLDITAAGHLLANETVRDGVREIEEETGIKVLFNDLILLGVIHDCIDKDREFAHVFLYKTNLKLADFHLQKEEVAGMVKISFKDFTQLWLGEEETIKVIGISRNEEGKVCSWLGDLSRNQFVPHSLEYYKTVIKEIKKYIK